MKIFHYQIISLLSLVSMLIHTLQGNTSIGEALFSIFCLINFSASIAFDWYDSRAPKATKSALELQIAIETVTAKNEELERKVNSLTNAMALTKANPGVRRF